MGSSPSAPTIVTKGGPSFDLNKHSYRLEMTLIQIGVLALHPALPDA